MAKIGLLLCCSGMFLEASKVAHTWCEEGRPYTGPSNSHAELHLVHEIAMVQGLGVRIRRGGERRNFSCLEELGTEGGQLSVLSRNVSPSAGSPRLPCFWKPLLRQSGRVIVVEGNRK